MKRKNNRRIIDNQLCRVAMTSHKKFEKCFSEWKSTKVCFFLACPQIYTAVERISACSVCDMLQQLASSSLFSQQHQWDHVGKYREVMEPYTVYTFPISMFRFPALCIKRLPHTIHVNTQACVCIHEFCLFTPTKCTVQRILKDGHDTCGSFSTLEFLLCRMC